MAPARVDSALPRAGVEPAGPPEVPSARCVVGLSARRARLLSGSGVPRIAPEGGWAVGARAGPGVRLLSPQEDPETFARSGTLRALVSALRAGSGRVRAG